MGMSRTAVWLAWGSPDRKIVGNMGGGHDGDLALYLLREWRIIRPTGRGVSTSGILFTIHSIIRSPPSISYPAKVVTFARGRVVSYQYVESQP